MRDLFYNTTSLEGRELREKQRQSGNQSERVLKIFHDARLYGHFHLTPDYVHRTYCQRHKDTPLTSIRRVITNLTESGKLAKTDIKKAGSYGMLTHTWRLR